MDHDRRRALGQLAALLMFDALPAGAGTGKNAPAGSPLLILEHPAGRIALDIEDLTRMPSVEFVTGTIWTRGPQHFRGVQLCDLVAWAGGGDMHLIRAYTADEFVAEIPISDAIPGGPIVAYLRNGRPMGRRDHGPLWLVYPYDSNSNYRDAQTYARSVWQLDRLSLH